jgi:hypothetical protein
MTHTRQQALIAGALVIALAPVAARAYWIGGGIGYGLHRTSYPGTAYLVRWQYDLQPWRFLERYAELAAGNWTGNTDNNVLSVSLGARYGLTANVRLYGSLGAGYVTEHTENLGTHGQFAWCLGATYRFGTYEVAFSQIHYSNGREIFGSRGPNAGDNFLMLTVMRSLD